jgi:hypothetical protein
MQKPTAALAMANANVAPITSGNRAINWLGDKGGLL